MLASTSNTVFGETCHACEHESCWLNCWLCVKQGSRRAVGEALAEASIPDVMVHELVLAHAERISHRGNQGECAVVMAAQRHDAEMQAAELARIPDDGAARPFTVTSSGIHRADCSVVNSGLTFWRKHLTDGEAVAAMERKGAGPIYRRCQRCAPDVPEPKRYSQKETQERRLRRRLDRGEHIYSGLGWPS